MATAVQPSGATYRFGPFDYQAGSNRLHKHGLSIRMERKPLLVLTALLERPGQIVSREELQRRLWSEDTFVDFELGLRVAVNKLREALGDAPDHPKYIETAVGEGYRFIAPVEVGTAAETAPLPAPPEPPAKPAVPVWRWSSRFALAGALVLLAVAGARLAWQGLRDPEPARAGKVMLVVLPFENLSGDPGQEYLSDGMTEELSEHLGELSPEQLGVIGRTSAMTYKHSRKTISEIGKDLAVDYVVEGSVRRDGNKLRVTAQLVQVSGQTHVWAQNYDRQMQNLLQVEDEVAGEIARQVGVSIAVDQPIGSLNHHIPDPEAHEAYLLGRYYWNKRTPEGWANAEKYFRRAIEKDPRYAAAYAGLAECQVPKREAQAVAIKAVELDPASGEALTALGWVQLFRDLDLAAAERTLKSAIHLDPNNAPAHHLYSGVLELSGRLQEAIEEEKQATLLDPLSPILKASLAEVLSLAGQHDRGVEQLKRVFEMDPKFPKAHETLGLIYLRKGMYKEAIHEFRTSEEYGGSKLTGLLGYAHALSGDKKVARRALSELRKSGKTSGAASYDLAVIEVGLGNTDQALSWLERAYQLHDDDGLLWLKVDPAFDRLRSDPRFQDLLRRMNFPS